MSAKQNFIIDTIALMLYIILMLPDWTGYWFHEWIAVAVGLVFIVHLIAHYDWTQKTAQSFFGSTTFMSRLNLIIDILLLIAAAVTMVSGLMVSQHILPMFGFFGPAYFFWNPIHAVAAKVFTALMIAHLATHWQWYFTVFKSNRSKVQGETQKED